MKTIKWYRKRGVFDDLQVVPANEHRRLVEDLDRIKTGLETISRYTGETRHPNGVWDAHVIAGRLLAGKDQNGCDVPQRGTKE